MRDEPRPNNGQADYSMDATLTNELVRDSHVYSNLRQDFIITTEDRLRLCLMASLEATGRRKDWLAPAGILATLVATLVATSQFKDFVLSAAVWRALFVLASFATFVWLAHALIQAIRTRSRGIETIVDELKKGSPRGVAERFRLENVTSSTEERESEH